MLRGEALLAAGDAAAALPWLRRARQIAPEDDTVGLTFAMALLATGDPRAGAALADLAHRHDVQEVWLALAAARSRAEAPAGAAEALAAALARHVLAAPEAVGLLAAGIAAQAGAPGWCGLARDGSLLWGGLEAGARPVVRVDGRPLRGRRVPAGGVEVAVMRDGVHLLGSPIQAAHQRRVEGVVTVRDGVLEGWAWHPADAGRDPELTIAAPDGTVLGRLVATDQEVRSPRPLARPRRFAVAGLDAAVHVRGADGRDLVGSPLDPGQEARAAAAAARAVARALPLAGRMDGEVPFVPAAAAVTSRAAAAAPSAPWRPAAVVVPVYRDLETTRACLHAVFATVPAGTAVVAVDDATPEPPLAALLDSLAAAGRLHLVRHGCNQGFPAAANAGLRAAARLPGGPDVVLLNSDTLPAPGWLETLRAAVHGAADIGTACPISNDATILGYPDPLQPSAPPGSLHDLAALLRRTHGAATVDIPTAVGFCMYIRRECLAETGLFRTDVFAQGYGEENDFCLRARHLGWRHVAAPGAYVAHLGGRSFGTARAALLDRNLDVLERLHPGWRTLIEAWQAADPLAPARRAIDRARWLAADDRRPSVLVVTHDHQGGVERAIRERCAALAEAGLRAVLLRPVVDVSGSDAAAGRRYLPGLCAVGDESPGSFPNLRFTIPADLAELADLLRAVRPVRMEVHHRLGHHPAILDLAARLGIPYELRVHDYALFCMQFHLVGFDRRYCGEPDVAGCEACVADAGSAYEEPLTPAALRARSAAEIAGAARVVVPSADAAARIARHFPHARPIIEPHEDDTDLPPLRPLPPPPRRVGVLGGIGVYKGIDVLIACARDAARRDLPLSFTVLGHTLDDARALATGRIFVTGPYRPQDLPALLAETGVQLGFVPSIAPETWCYTLGELWRAGLAVVAFDIGAPGERIRRTARGTVLPLGLPPAAINNALLALQTVAGDVMTSAAPRR